MFMVIENDDDREFISALYYNNYKLWIKTAYSYTHDMSTAEDMVNDTFVKLFDYIDKLREIGCYKAVGYIVISISSTCKTYLTKMSKAGNVVELDADNNSEHIESSFSTEDTVFKKLDYELAARVIRKLDPLEQDFLVKSYFEQIGDREIAKRTGMAYNNIRTYRCRLINKIKKLCKKESEEKIDG